MSSKKSLFWGVNRVKYTLYPTTVFIVIYRFHLPFTSEHGRVSIDLGEIEGKSLGNGISIDSG